MLTPEIPSAISPREARFMQSICKEKRVVEFGALLGFSTIILAEVAGSLTSVDRHIEYSGPTLNQLISNLHRYGVNDSVRVIEGDAATWSNLAGDIAFIDLTGQYEITKRVLSGLSCKLALVHDFDRPNCDVGRGIRDAGWKVIGHVDSLVLCERWK